MSVTKEIFTKDKEREPTKKFVPGWLNFAVGGTSGMMAICIVQPTDLVKTRMQLMGSVAKHVSMVQVTKNVIRKEGFGGLYVGISAALFRQATYSTGRLGVFNSLFNYYNENYGVPNLLVKICFGIIAGGVGAFIGTPAEVCLIRMTADGRLPPEKRRNYAHVLDAIRRIIKEEGVTTLWRGAVPTIVRAMVVNGVQFGTYAQFREMLLETMGDGVPLHFTASMIAGLVSSIALPFDNIKTRVQNAAKGVSQISVVKNVIRTEGFLSLWSGFWPSYLKLGPHTVFTFIFMEQLNKLYHSFNRD